jgi:hypothetical protein
MMLYIASQAGAWSVWRRTQQDAMLRFMPFTFDQVSVAELTPSEPTELTWRATILLFETIYMASLWGAHSE